MPVNMEDVGFAPTCIKFAKLATTLSSPIPLNGAPAEILTPIFRVKTELPETLADRGQIKNWWNRRFECPHDTL